MEMITNDDPVMARAMLAVQEACAVAVDRLVRRGLEEFAWTRAWAVLRIDLSAVYGSTDIKTTVHGPFPSVADAEVKARRLRGRTFVLGPVEAP